MANEKRLIDANEFWKRLTNVVYDFFTVHEKDGRLSNTASVGYYRETIQEVLKQTKTVDAVEAVHGRWDKNWSGDNIVYCNQCYMPQDVPTPYCASCGAKMDGDGNG